MKVGILATGTTPEELAGQYGTYAELFVKLFQGNGYNFDFHTFDVRDDVFPQGIEGFDGWIITGSKFNVEDNDPWMIRLKDLIKEIYGADQPMVGICFGHQIVADAFGGEVIKNPLGWGVGLHSYDVLNHPSAIPADVSEFTISALHQFQVSKKPDNAIVFAQSEFCPLAGLVYGNKILTFQAHPEFPLDYEDDLVDLRKGDVIPEDQADAGLATCRAPGAAVDSHILVHWMAKFLTR